MANRYFADISSNNSTYGSAVYKKAGHVLIAIKATEAEGYVNPRYVQWVQDSHKNGLTVAHYHFARPERDDGASEFRHFWSIVRDHFKKGDYVVLDLETNAGNPAVDTRFAKEFYAAAAKVGIKPVLYSGAYYLQACGPGVIPPRGRIWVAAYGPKPGKLPRGGWQWAWQFTDGVSGPQPHACAGIGQGDVSILNPASYAYLKVRTFGGKK